MNLLFHMKIDTCLNKTSTKIAMLNSYIHACKFAFEASQSLHRKRFIIVIHLRERVSPLVVSGSLGLSNEFRN